LKLYFVASVLSFFLIVGIVVFDTDLVIAKKEDSKSKKSIELCCTWGDSLDDGVLTFSINKGGSDLAKIVKLAINDWEKSLGGIEFKYVKEDTEADIKIDFKKGKGKKVGKTVTYFDHYGLIDQVDISISKKSYGVTLDKETLEHVTKHEIGHALGLGHANFNESIMSALVYHSHNEISNCEIEAIAEANKWKLIDNTSLPKLSQVKQYYC
jgi:Matrixin